MPEITNFAQANKALLSFVPPLREDRKYTLEGMVELMEYLGNPQNKLKVIHVAGTSGKTSTGYYAAAMLRVVGYKVGLTVSPHIDEVNERVQINGKPMGEAPFCKELNNFLKLVEEFDGKPSYFEVLIAFMYWLFAKTGVDYAVVEVGLGGLLDGTNVIQRADKVCIITDIGLDHTQVLGKTIEEIAAQKAGIIYPHNTVFSYQQDENVMAVIREVCEQNQAELHEIIQPDSRKTPAELPLFQRRNWYLASRTIQYVLERDAKPLLTQEQLQTTAQTLVPARMEIFQIGSKTVIVDGSHNEQKISTLLKSIRHKYPDQPLAALVSFGHNKSTSLQANLSLLSGAANHIIVTVFKLGQDEIRTAVNPKKIVEICHRLGYNEASINMDPAEAFRELLDRPEHLLLVTGSFYLLNHVRPLILNR